MLISLGCASDGADDDAMTQIEPDVSIRTADAGDDTAPAEIVIQDELAAQRLPSDSAEPQPAAAELPVAVDAEASMSKAEADAGDTATAETADDVADDVAAVADDNAEVAAAIAKPEVNVDQIRTDISWLADDAREGRGIGTDGLNEAGEYIAKRFDDLGLKKAGNMDSYFQTWDRSTGMQLVEGSANLSFGDDTLEYGQTFSPYSWSTAGEFEGPLAFGGYSLVNEDRGINDYDGVDVDGKVVLVFRHEPRLEDGTSKVTGDNRMSIGSRFSTKAEAAVKAGAKAMIIVEPAYSADRERLTRFGRGELASDIPVMQVTREAAEKMLSAAQMPDLEMLEGIANARVNLPDADADAAENGGNAEAAPAVELTSDLVVKGGFETEENSNSIRNVVAVLPGKKTDEYIVVGAHYDHVGLGNYGSRPGNSGQIHNGADDNGSGTTALLAIAEMLSKGEQPDRSIMFVAFTAEEVGLVGSRYITQAENSPVPLDQLKAMVNFDMVGRLRDETLNVGGFKLTEAYPKILEAADEASPVKLSDMGSDFGGRSDQASYNNIGVPAIFFFTGLHEEYHTPADDVDLINIDGMAEIVDLGYDVIMAIDDTPEDQLQMLEQEPQEVMNNRNANAEGGSGQGRRVRFGMMPDMDFDGPGVMMSRVFDDTPAKAAGFQEGDVLLQLGDQEVNSLQDLQTALQTLEPGKTYPARFKRGSAEATVNVEIAARQSDDDA